MPERRLRILQVNTHDVHGGASKIGWDLFRAFRARGHSSYLAVDQKGSDDPDVLLIPGGTGEPSRGWWFRFWKGIHDSCLQPLIGRGVPGVWRLSSPVCRVATWQFGPPDRWREWGRRLDRRRGLEDFRFPGTWRLLELAPQPPEIVHCHNLHGGYFDLRALPWLSHRVPVILSLHDPWLLAGHCSHSFDCERWKVGCGRCPDLTIYPAIERDASAANWRRKRRIYARSRLHVATPCRWLMDRVEQSMLAEGIREARIIPYGVDLSVFRPADRQTARRSLDIPPDAVVFLFVAYGLRTNRAKDYQTLRGAMERVGGRLHERKVLFIARGEDAPPDRIGSVEVRYVPFRKDFADVVSCYQAADVYLHAAHVDTFPNVVLEALACGTPVVATGVGGIPEQVKSLKQDGKGWTGTAYGADDATGILVPPQDADGMAAASERLLQDRRLLHRLGENAARDARERFDLQRQVGDYLDWYEELVRRAGPPHQRQPARSYPGL